MTCDVPRDDHDKQTDSDPTGMVSSGIICLLRQFLCLESDDLLIIIILLHILLFSFCYMNYIMTMISGQL